MVILVAVVLPRFFRRRRSTRVQHDAFAVTDPGRIVTDIPYRGNFHQTSALLRADDSDVISAYMLKWIVDGRLEEEMEVKGFLRKREVLSLRVAREGDIEQMNVIERSLWTLVREAMGRDDLLSEKEFSKYVRKNVSEFNAWTSQLAFQSTIAMKDEGYMSEVPHRVFIFNTTTTAPNERGLELINNVQGFKNYLSQYSLLREREVTHVSIWDDYMIWAAYMGIAEKVYEQLKISDPNFENVVHYDPITLSGIQYFSSSAISAQSSANSSSSSSSSSSYSGGGGSSFSGGGGGASGGSSGGGTR